jgi:hypothetical protein
MKWTTLGILGIVEESILKMNFFCMFNGAVSISHCITSNDWMVVMDELGRIWKEVVIA